MKSYIGKILLVLCYASLSLSVASAQVIKLDHRNMETVRNQDIWFSGGMGLGTSVELGEVQAKIQFDFVEFFWEEKEFLFLGKVTDQYTDEPLPMAAVRIASYIDDNLQLKKEVFTDIGGNFQLQAAVDSTDIIFVACIGYVTPVYDIHKLLYNKSVSQDILTLEKRKIYSSFDEALKTPQDVYRLDISSQRLESITQEIVKLTNLIYFNLSGNDISELPSEIGQLKNLEDLILHNNRLSGLPSTIEQLGNLKSLNLGKNQFSHIPFNILSLPNLESL